MQGLQRPEHPFSGVFGLPFEVDRPLSQAVWRGVLLQLSVQKGNRLINLSMNEARIRK
jgi:hypothetical protein